MVPGQRKKDWWQFGGTEKLLGDQVCIEKREGVVREQDP